MQYRFTEPITMNDVINHWRHRYGAGLRYIMSRKGLLTIGAGYAGAFLRTRPEVAARSDCDTVVAGMKAMRRIMNEPAMRRYIAQERAPGEHCVSDGELLAFARDTGTTVYHPASTCRMGHRPFSRRRRALARARFRAPARDRCLDHADGGIRQYQCRGGDDRRKRRRRGAGGRCYARVLVVGLAGDDMESEPAAA